MGSLEFLLLEKLLQGWMGEIAASAIRSRATEKEDADELAE